MAIPESLKSAFDKADFDAVESAWIERMDDAPDDLDFFVGTGRALVGQGQEETAKMLLRLLEDELAETGQTETRVGLLRRAGSVFLSPRALQESAVDCLQALHGSHGRFDDMLRVAGLKKKLDRSRDLWRRVDNLLSLLEFDVDTIVTMDGQGIGRILDTNTDLETFRIEFPATAPMNVGFRAAAKMLTAIPEGSLRYRLVTDPEAAGRELAESPHLLLQEVLQAAGGAMASAEIKKALAGVLAEKEWNKWWAAARKHPQVVPDANKRNAYRWADSDEHAEEALMTRFQRSDLEGKLRVLAEVRDRIELREQVAASLREQVLEASTDATAVATTWVRLRRTIDSAEDQQLPPLLAEAPADDLATTLGSVQPPSDRRAAYQFAALQRPDWSQVVEHLLTTESEPRLAGDLLEELDGEARNKAMREVVRRSGKAPAAFIQVAERYGNGEAVATVKAPLLLRKLISARSQDAFADFRPRLASMFQSGGVVPRLLSGLSEEEAEQVYPVIEDSRLSSAERGGLLTALETRFPGLRQESLAGLYALRTSIDQRREELRQLKEEEIPSNRKAVEEAAALGDLRENFEYKSARERQEYLSSRVAKLEGELSSVQPLDLAQAGGSEVRIGSTVTLSGDPELSFTILGPWESQPDDGVISYQSELGSSLLGKSVGDRVLAGDEEREVQSIGVYSPDDASA